MISSDPTKLSRELIKATTMQCTIWHVNHREPNFNQRPSKWHWNFVYQVQLSLRLKVMWSYHKVIHRHHSTLIICSMHRESFSARELLHNFFYHFSIIPSLFGNTLSATYNIGVVIIVILRTSVLMLPSMFWLRFYHISAIFSYSIWSAESFESRVRIQFLNSTNILIWCNIHHII